MSSIKVRSNDECDHKVAIGRITDSWDEIFDRLDKEIEEEEKLKNKDSK